MTTTETAAPGAVARQSVPDLRPSRSSRLRGWFTSQLPLKITLIVVAIVALVPIVVLVILSFYSESVLARPGHFTVENYVDLASQPSTWEYLANTLLFTGGGGIIGVILGTVMAFAVTTVNVPFPNLLRALPLGTMLIPGLLKDSSWLMLFSQHTGLVNTWLGDWFGNDSLINVSSVPGLIVAGGVFTAPVAYVVMLAPLGALDRSYLEASNVAGARIVRTFVRVIFPMVRPAAISAAILVMLTIAASFETPIILGRPGGIVTYMTLIYNTVSGSALHLNTAATQAVFYLILTAVVMLFYMRATRNERRFVVVSGKGNTRARVESKPLAAILTIVILVQAILGFIGPVIITFLVSFLPFFTTTQGNPFVNWTLQNYQAVLADPQIQSSILSSTLLALATVVGSVIIGGVIAYAALKSGLKHSRISELVGMGPLAVPPTVYSVGLLLTVLASPAIASWAYGSIGVMFIASVIAFLPIVTRLLTSALIQIQDDLLAAATLSGASRLTTVRTIIVPLLRPAVASCVAVVFLLSYRELGAVVLLISRNTELIPFVIFRFLRGGNFTEVAALNMIMLVVPAIFALIAFSLGVDRSKGKRLRSARELLLSSKEGSADVAA